jgi:hypothetical protein
LGKLAGLGPRYIRFSERDVTHIKTGKKLESLIPSSVALNLNKTVWKKSVLPFLVYGDPVHAVVFYLYYRPTRLGLRGIVGPSLPG